MQLLDKKLNIDKKVSANLPIDPENAIIIIPNNIEVITFCTNLTPTFDDLAKREEV